MWSSLAPGPGASRSNSPSTVVRRMRDSSSAESRYKGSQGGNPQRRLEQVPAAAHLDGVLREPPDVALHDVELLGGVARFQRLLAASCRADLMDQDLRLRRHVAARAREAAGRRTWIRSCRLGASVARCSPRSTGTALVRPIVVIMSRPRMVRPSARGAQHRAAVGIEHQHRSTGFGGPWQTPRTRAACRR